MTTKLNINCLNTQSVTDFTTALADIYEHSAWIPERAAPDRPFDNVTQLHNAMVARLSLASDEEKLGLLGAHPELAGKAAQRGDLSNSSTSEQTCAKLDDLSSQEMAHITNLNKRYQIKFGFPFIIAVLKHNKDSIFSEFERRVENDLKTEFNTALEQVNQIAQLRLQNLLVQ